MRQIPLIWRGLLFKSLRKAFDSFDASLLVWRSCQAT
jgi:hypothetical protein